MKGFNRPIFKKFATRSEAEKHCLDNGGQLDGAAASPQQPTATDVSTKPATKRPASAFSATATAAAAKRTKLIELPVPSADTVGMKKHGDLYFTEDDAGYVHVYTDGSCEGNGTSKAIAGLGVYFAEGHVL